MLTAGHLNLVVEKRLISTSKFRETKGGSLENYELANLNSLLIKPKRSYSETDIASTSDKKYFHDLFHLSSLAKPIIKQTCIYQYI